MPITSPDTLGGRPWPRGVWATVLLPLNADGTIDHGALQTQLDTLAGLGVEGIYAFGTAGEFHAITEAEYDRVAQQVSEMATKSGLPFQIGVCDANPRISLDRARRLSASGATALQVVLPDWVAPSDEEAIRFLEGIAIAADPCPLVLYNPPHAKRRLTTGEIGRLARAVPAVIGVKILDGDAQWYDQARPLFDQLSVFIPGHRMATGVLAGAHGSYSNMACLSPSATLGWWRLIQTEPERALAVERDIAGLFRDVVQPMLARGPYQPFAFDKALAAIGGWAPLDATVRWPYTSLPPTELTVLDGAIRERLGDLLALDTTGRWVTASASD